MRKKLLGLFAALGMMVTGVAASVAPTAAQAQSFHRDRGHDGFRRGYHRPPARGFRGYRNDRRGFRGGYRNDRRGYRGYRDNRRPGRFDHRRYDHRR